MKLFTTPFLAACCVLALSSFAFMPAAPAAKASAPPGASLKITSISTITTTTIDVEGNKHQTTVTKLECSGPAFDCAVNSAGDPVHVPPVVL